MSRSSIQAYLLGVLAVIGFSGANVAQQPHWIWKDRNRKTDRAVFQTQFTIVKPVTSATLRGLGDSAAMDVYLDGKWIQSVEPYDPLFEIDVTPRIRMGVQSLSASCLAADGPSAVFLQLELKFADGSLRTLVTDETWTVASESNAATPPVISQGPIDERLSIPDARRVGIAATDNYEQWKQALGSGAGTSPASFLVTPGFEIELIRSAADDEDSWVSMTFDPRGRIIIAKEEQGLLRMTLSEDGTHVIYTETINDSLKECRGLLFAAGDLFANANNSRGMYRLPGLKNDQFGEPILLYGSSGGVGHGRNDLALGADGKIYSIHGDSVDLPADAVDLTSPFRDARRGIKTSEGHLVRVDPESREVEVLAAGLRNPFGIDFNRHGEIFTYDADAEYDMGAPWYRPTRVSHLVTGGDYGWRGVTKSWPPYYPDHPDNARPNIDIRKGSPTALKFGIRSNFPKRYRDALFILDWAYGRILAVHVLPRGSSYMMTAETFVKGRPLNVTDLDFGPRGSMYLVTGGRKTQSALYRIRYQGEDGPSPKAATSQQTAREAFAERGRRIRRSLETDLVNQLDDEQFESVWSNLASDDPWIRHAARNVIERQPLSRWQQRAYSDPDRVTALVALLALSRAGDETIRNRVVDRLNELDWTQGRREVQEVAIYAYWLCLEDAEAIDADTLERAIARLQSVFPSRSFASNRLLSELLLRLDAERSLTKTVELLRKTPVQAEQMHYLFVLRSVDQGWSRDERELYFRSMAEMANYLGGAGLPDFINKIREEAIATLSPDDRQASAAWIDIASPQEPVGEPVSPRPFVRKWTLEMLADSLQQVDKHRDLTRGAALFHAASCAKCHRIGSQGTLVGPELSSAANRFGRQDLLDAILSPSKVIADKYRSIQIVTSEGKTFVGQTALGGDYRSPILRLATDPNQPFKVTEIPKTDIVRQQTSAVSWMPEGLLDTLAEDEILDLLAYIESGSPDR